MAPFGLINFEELDCIDDTKAIPLWQRVESNDVLLAIRGSLGKAALVLEIPDYPLYITSNTAVLRPDTTRLNPFYLWLWLQSQLREGGAKFKRSSTGQQSVSLREIQAMEVPLLELDIQNNIQKAVKLMLAFRRNQLRQEVQTKEFIESLVEEIFHHD